MDFSHTFYDVITSFPTAIPSVLLLVVLIYWIMAVIGLVDIDALDAGHLDAGGHIDLHHSASGAHESGLLASTVLSLGITGVPLSIVISIIVLVTWVLSYLCQRYLLMAMPDILRWGFGSLALAASFVGSLPIGVIMLRPLRGAFVVHSALNNENLVGKTCRILTMEVSAKFGQAFVKDNGSGYTVKVWSQEPNAMHKGSEAVLVAYDRSTQRFEVAELATLELQGDPSKHRDA